MLQHVNALVKVVFHENMTLFNSDVFSQSLFHFKVKTPFPPTHPGCFTDSPLQAHQQKQQAVGSGSGKGHTDHPWGCMALGSSVGKGRGLLFSSRWEQAPPLAPLSLPPWEEEEVAVGGP